MRSFSCMRGGLRDDLCAARFSALNSRAEVKCAEEACFVSKTADVPYDYDGVMGVPITFMDKYNPEQFEIVGMCENENLYGLKTRVYGREECQKAYYAKFGKKGTYDLNASGVLTINGIQEKVYQRILIRRKK